MNWGRMMIETCLFGHIGEGQLVGEGWKLRIWDMRWMSEFIGHFELS